ncbi:uncharacterized protein PV07_11898 [Cladophialophora immunda]|uniref:Sulfatase N-terminal domain-containing protein n=1 Tax=Cladophialophora immunda TaxID=569365 RepID=A0A0D2BZG6_9EURO|nr:uncharacterized protein PV07_11898 [Cladophialophora immunda]KIW23720.1 hypothetical protein PV07_11898 [Cladophialophora immunda]
MGSIDNSRKNILFLIADDLGKCLGCYGAKGLRTPNIDKLAANGTSFDLAFTSTASCSASRTVMYTGLHPHENGQYGLAGGTSHFQSFDHVQSAPTLFNALGYQTGIVGKVHVGPAPVFPWESREESETRNVAWVAERAEAFFERAKETKRPFFLTVGYVDPHRDITTRSEFGNGETCEGKFVAPDFQPDQVEIPAWLTDLPETRIEYVEYYKAIARMDYGVGLVLDALERKGLASSTLVVLCSDNGPPFINSKTTLYDAGTQLPFIVRAPGCSQPGTRNPNMISYIDILPTFLAWAGAPLEFRAPIELPKGQVYTLETRPPPPPRRLGRSFLHIIGCSDVLPEDQWQHKVYGSHTFHEIANYWPTRVVRNRRFKYHRNIAWQLDFPFASDLYASLTLEGVRKNHQGKPGQEGADVLIGARSLKQYVRRPAEELYDLESDPVEVRNLADQPEYASVLAQMRHECETWQEETKDPWLLRDGQSVMALRRYAGEKLKMPTSFDFVLDSVALGGMERYRVDDPRLVSRT